MSAIQTFSVRLVTSRHPDAGTDGDVYVGVCGREFYIDSAAVVDDFERGSDRTYNLVRDGMLNFTRPTIRATITRYILRI
jgi:hypothetical protein